LTAEAVGLGVDVAARPAQLDHLGTASLEGQRPEVGGAGVAVQPLEEAQRVAQVVAGAAGPVLVEPVVVFGVLPVGQGQLVDGQVGRGTFRAPGRQAPAVGLPLRDDAGVLGPALGGAVLAEQHVAAAAQPIGEGDDGLAGLPVTAVLGDGGGSGHAGNPFWDARKTSALRRGFRPHFRPPEGTLNECSGTGLCRVGATGLEPVTPSLSSWCSSQLS
jgi:hypothetical protein